MSLLEFFEPRLRSIAMSGSIRNGALRGELGTEEKDSLRGKVFARLL